MDLCHASIQLLQRVCGLSSTKAIAIVNYQQVHGRIKSRHELLSVPGIGPVTYANIAGFLRIQPSATGGGQHNPLDNTLVHPEKYDVVNAFMNQIGFTKENGNLKSEHLFSEYLSSYIGSKDLKHYAHILKISHRDLIDIVNWITLAQHNPASDDVRQRGIPPLFRTYQMLHQSNNSIKTIGDVVVGAKLTGTVRNITSFGAFFDIGIKNDALLHISEYSSKSFVIGQMIEVLIKGVDVERNRIQLAIPSSNNSLESELKKRGKDNHSKINDQRETPKNRRLN